MKTNIQNRSTALSCCSSDESNTSNTTSNKRLKKELGDEKTPTSTNNEEDALKNGSEDDPNDSKPSSSCMPMHAKGVETEQETEASKESNNIDTATSTTSIGITRSTTKEENLISSSSASSTSHIRKKVTAVPDAEHEKMMIFLTSKSPKKRSRYEKAIKFPSKVRTSQARFRSCTAFLRSRQRNNSWNRRFFYCAAF